MKTRTVAATLLLLLVLTGCAGTPNDDVADEPQASETSQSAPEETETPLVAETPEPNANEAQYVEELRSALRPNNVIPNATDEQLIAAGLDACEQLNVGVSGDNLTVIEGEERSAGGYYEDSAVIATQARLFLCPA